jgi:chromate transport protein ChrA
MRRAVVAAVVALLLLTMYQLAKPVLRRPASIGLALIAFVVVTVFHVGVAWVVIGAGIVGVIAARRDTNGSR